MIAEIISIGDELTSGQRLDTNSQWLSLQLGDLGVKTVYHTTVADDLAANIRVFAGAVDRADLVIATGGLGPTADDLTREVLARVASVELELDQPSLDHIRQLFARGKREMPERNVVQAMFPRGSRPIFNERGTAPGIDMLVAATSDDHFARVFALPGVPDEMKEMWSKTVGPTVLAMQPSPRVICHKRIKCFGAGESQLEAMLPDLIARGREPSVGITVHAATITLRITASAETPEACYASMEPTILTIHECLGDLAFGTEDDELQDAVVRLLIDRKQSLATVELGTRGLLAHWLSEAAANTSVSITSQVFNNPPDFDANEVKRVGLESSIHFGSKEYVEELARRWHEKSGCDYTLAIGKFPESTSGDVASYHFALATTEKVVAVQASLSAHPSIWKPRAAKQALNLLRLSILRA